MSEMSGLTQSEAERRLAELGPNEPIASARRRPFGRVFERLANPLVAILLLASIVSGLMHDLTNAAIILVMVGASIAIELVQTRRSERAADALRARVAPTASVLRDGRFKVIARREVVRGDVIRLEAGDMVPADADLLQATDLHVNEAALTGESMPVEKAEGKGESSSVLMGSSVVSGSASAVVSRTGKDTAFGAIAAGLAGRPPPSEFERGIGRFGAFIAKVVFFLVVFVFALAVLLRRDPLESLLFAVALAVGLTPEFLPMITTVTLTRGAVRMSKAKVIVKNLAAIQNLGSIDILCSDKTGTLTDGQMVLEEHVEPFGAASERPLLLAAINSYFESGIENPLDVAVCEKARLDPIDSAVLRHEHPDLSGFRKLDEVPFDFERRRVSVVAERGDECILVTKGAPEHVLVICDRLEIGGATRAMTEEDRQRCRSTFEGLGRRGYRVLAVASTPAARRAFSKGDEHHLVLAGFIAFSDPPRAGIETVLRRLRSEGVITKVLTGDSDLVAAHVCERVGIDVGRILLGRDIDGLTDSALGHLAEQVHVFARMSPAQKNRVLLALKARGHVVGFLGDGINDAPSLRAADVGISVANAVDVAKDAADVVLLEPGLEVVAAGIMEGRRAFGNVMKYLLMGTSSNFGNMFSMAGAVALLPFLPMLPSQVLLNNFLYDVAQLTIPSDNVDDSLVHKPRRWEIAWIRRFMLWMGPISSLFDFVTFAVLLVVFRASEHRFQSGWFIESLATQTLVIFIIRTRGRPWKSRPSRALLISVMAVVAVGLVLPFTPLGGWFGFEPLPFGYFAFLVAAVVSYLALVEAVKGRIMGKLTEGR